MANYSYPLREYWSREELIEVVQCFSAVEQAYESGIALSEFQDAYRRFKNVVTSISEEKQLGREFEDISGYSLYRAVQAMKVLLDSKPSPMTLLKLEARRSRW